MKIVNIYFPEFFENLLKNWRPDILSRLLLICLIVSCSSKADHTVHIHDSTIVDKLNEYGYLDMVYYNKTFYVLNNWKTQLQAFKKDSLLSELELREMVATDNGFKISGQLIVGMKMMSDKLFFLQTHPYQYLTYQLDGQILPKPIKLKFPGEFHHIDFLIENDSTLLLASSNQRKTLSLFRYELNTNRYVEIFQSEPLIDPFSSKMNLYNSEIHLYFPYDKSYRILSQNGKLKQSLEISDNDLFEMIFREMPENFSPTEFMQLQVKDRLPFLKNEVLDFYFHNKNLYIISKVYNREAMDQLHVDIFLTIHDLSNKSHARIQTKGTAIKFDQKGNVFLVSDGYPPLLEIIPIDQLINEEKRLGSKLTTP